MAEGENGVVSIPASSMELSQCAEAADLPPGVVISADRDEAVGLETESFSPPSEVRNKTLARYFSERNRASFNSDLLFEESTCPFVHDRGVNDFTGLQGLIGKEMSRAKEPVPPFPEPAAVKA